MRHFLLRAVSGAVVLGHVASLAWPCEALAQEKPASETGKAVGKEKTASPAAASPVLPDADKIVLLIRTTLLTVSDALQTGNYTVLRDKAAPAFRDGTTPAGLMQTFAALNQQRIDLSPVAIIAPQLSEVPSLDGENRLKLKGYFPGKPVGIAFNITFEAVAGHWRLFAMSVGLARIAVDGRTVAGTP